MATRLPVLDDAQFAQIGKALGDPRRVELLQRLGSAEQAPTCSSVCEWLGLAPATVSHHLKELETAGLIQVERQGKFAHIRINRDVLRAYGKRLASI